MASSFLHISKASYIARHDRTCVNVYVLIFINIHIYTCMHTNMNRNRFIETTSSYYIVSETKHGHSLISGNLKIWILVLYKLSEKWYMFIESKFRKYVQIIKSPLILIILYGRLCCYLISNRKYQVSLDV